MRQEMLRRIARLYLWATHRLYNELAFLYDLASWLVSAGHWAEWRDISLEYVAGARVLDVGFGTGELLAGLAGHGVRACGLEPSWAMQRVAARKLRHRGIAVPRICGRVQAFPVADSCFDTIISTFPADYIADIDALREIRRALRRPTGTDDSGGRLVIVGLAVYRVGEPVPRRFHVEETDPGMQRFCDRLSTAGLSARPISRYQGASRVPVVLAERWP
jgi:ubiquinone/menaquinone biosynthesis C-methylase UbiE